MTHGFLLFQVLLVYTMDRKCQQWESDICFRFLTGIHGGDKNESCAEKTSRVFRLFSSQLLNKKVSYLLFLCQVVLFQSRCYSKINDFWDCPDLVDYKPTAS